jgi:hypothetical protein
MGAGLQKMGFFAEVASFQGESWHFEDYGFNVSNTKSFVSICGNTSAFPA